MFFGAELLLAQKSLEVLGEVISERIFVFTEQLLEIIVFIQLPLVVLIPNLAHL